MELRWESGMICKNCNAQISEKKLLCPYCGAENAEVAKKQQQDYLKSFEEKKKTLKKVPEKVVRKTTKWLLYGAMGTLALVILVIIVVIGFSGLTNADMMAKQEKELEKLEQYYLAGDYEKLSSYLDKINSTNARGGRYEKYWRIVDIYDSMDWHIKCLKSNTEYVKNIDLDAMNVEEDLERCIAVLYKIYEMEELDFPYGEEVGAKYFEEKYILALKEYALLTDEEIENAVLNYQTHGDNDFMELAEISIQRMEEQFR